MVNAGSHTTMTLYDEIKARQLEAGITKTSFYICQSCAEITESADYTDKCHSCQYQGALIERSTIERATEAQEQVRENIKERIENSKIPVNLVGTVESIANDIVIEETRQELKINLAKGKWLRRGAEIIIEHNPIYFDQTETWWVWNHQKKSWEEKDETDILNLCHHTLELVGDTSIRHSNLLLKALQQVGRQKQPKELPLEMIQCSTKIINIKTMEQTESTPEYFSTNPIPWELGKTTNTPILDELITSWIGKELLNTMYEIIAYTLYREYPIHRVFCFVGSGSNGKSRVFKIIDKFLGGNNKSSVSLKKLSGNDFAIYPLYRKLICYVGETSHHALESTEIIKSLSGQDPVSFEGKGKNSFTGYNYAKLFLGTNMLPPSTDNSRGWYRRWFIINFPHEFPEGEDVCNRITDEEYSCLLTKCLSLLPALLQRGNFSTEGTIEERQAKYIANSNPFKEYLDLWYDRDTNSSVRYGELYNEYLSFLSERKLRRISYKEFRTSLEDQGLEMHKSGVREADGSTTSFNVVLGLKRLPKQRCFTVLSVLPGSYSVPDHIFSIVESTNTIKQIKQIKQDKMERFFSWINDGEKGMRDIISIEKIWPDIAWETLIAHGELYEPLPGYLKTLS